MALLYLALASQARISSLANLATGPLPFCRYWSMSASALARAAARVLSSQRGAAWAVKTRAAAIAAARWFLKFMGHPVGCVENGVHFSKYVLIFRDIS